MYIIILTGIIKTFFFLRVFESMSYTVAILSYVVSKLQSFLVFYVLVIGLISLLLGVIGYGNRLRPGRFANESKDYPNSFEVPGSVYFDMGMLMGNFIYSLDASIGNFDTSAVPYLKPNEERLYWVTWHIIFFFLTIVVLNFLIAEISHIYEEIRPDI